MKTIEKDTSLGEPNKDRAVFDYVGRALRAHPDILDSLDPRDVYILLARSDVSVRRPSSELSDIFRVTPTRINQLYHKALSHIQQHNNVASNSPPILTSPAVSKSRGLRISEGLRAKYQDPEFKTRVREAMLQAQQRRIGTETSVHMRGVYDIDPTDQELWEYVLENDLKGVLVQRGFLSESEVEMLSKYFGQEKGARNIESLLNRLSLALAKLA